MNCCRELGINMRASLLLIAHTKGDPSLFSSAKLVSSWGFPLLWSRLRTLGSLEGRGQSNFCTPMWGVRKSMGYCHCFSPTQRASVPFWLRNPWGSRGSFREDNRLLFIFSRGQFRWHVLSTTIHWMPLGQGKTMVKRIASSLPSLHWHMTSRAYPRDADIRASVTKKQQGQHFQKKVIFDFMSSLLMYPWYFS